MPLHSTCLVEVGVQVLVSRFWFCLFWHTRARGYLLLLSGFGSPGLHKAFTDASLVGRAGVSCSCSQCRLLWHHEETLLNLDDNESFDSETTSAGWFLLGGGRSSGFLKSAGTLPGHCWLPPAWIPEDEYPGFLLKPSLTPGMEGWCCAASL